MSVNVHPSAVVARGAKLGRGVEIGPYAVIGEHVSLGDGCRVHHHATVEGHTTLGENCEVFPYAALGLPPQDLKFRGEPTRLDIGRNNMFREMSTVHPGTDNGGGVTRVGDNNLIMIGVHVAHDCVIGNRCIIANYVQFAGHVHVENNVNMGGHSAVHHFVTIGEHAFIGGLTRVASDVPPYVVMVAARGTRPEIRMINGVGLQRNGFSREDVQALKDAYMKLFSRRARQGASAISDRVQAILDATPLNPCVEKLCRFMMRSFAHGRHGRYLESLRRDPVHRDTWKPGQTHKLTVEVLGQGSVTRDRRGDSSTAAEVVELTARAEPGWNFAGWNGGLSGDANPQRVVLDRDLSVAATFTRDR